MVFRVYKTGTTTANGNVGGTTVIDTNRLEPDGAFTNSALKITSGAYAGQERAVTSWVKSTGTFTVTPAFGGQILSGVTYEVGVYLPKYPYKFVETNPTYQDAYPFPGDKPIVVSTGLQLRSLDVEAILVAAGNTKAQLKVLYIDLLKALLHAEVKLETTEGLYDGTWLFERLLDTAEPKYGTRAFLLQMKFTQGSTHVVL
jgi:hypothetical protein